MMAVTLWMMITMTWNAQSLPLPPGLVLRASKPVVATNHSSLPTTCLSAFDFPFSVTQLFLLHFSALILFCKLTNQLHSLQLQTFLKSFQQAHSLSKIWFFWTFNLLPMQLLLQCRKEVKILSKWQSPDSPHLSGRVSLGKVSFSAIHFLW